MRKRVIGVRGSRKTTVAKYAKVAVPCAVAMTRDLAASVSSPARPTTGTAPGHARPAATNRGWLAPRDAVELGVAQICEDVLRVEGPGVTDSLFADDVAGATAVLAAVEARFGVAPPLSQLLAAPTIAALACALRSRARRWSWQACVALQRRGAARPLFLLPGGDGDACHFYALARHMGPERPVYGLQASGLGDVSRVPRAEELALAHVESIRAVQPRGPYLLAGHCSGAIVGLALALELERRGERVALLAALDSAPPSRFYTLDTDYIRDPAEFYVTIARGFKHWYGRELSLDVEALRAVPSSRRAAHFMALARAVEAYPPDAEDDRIERLRRGFSEFVDNPYTLTGVLSAPIADFRASDSPFSTDASWEEVTRGPVSVHVRPGNHVSIVTEPNAGAMARELAAVIAGAERI